MNEPFEITFNLKADQRGMLGFFDGSTVLPFNVERFYWLSGVPDNQLRGGHAHKTSEQIIICTSGQIIVSLESREGVKKSYVLKDPSVGLYIPPLWWGEMVFKDGATMIGLASDQFSEDDYVRIREEF